MIYDFEIVFSLNFDLRTTLIRIVNVLRLDLKAYFLVFCNQSNLVVANKH